MKKRISGIFAVLLIAALLFGTLPTSVFAFSVDPKIQVLHKEDGKTNTTSFSSLASAVDAATDGDTVMLAGEVSSYITSENIEITKDITFVTGRIFGSNTIKYLQYNGASAPLFTVKKGAVLTIEDAAIVGSTNSKNMYGGLIRVEKGGALTINGTDEEPVYIVECILKAKGSRGGAIYAEQGGKVTVNGVIFDANSSASGSDIYAEQETDVTLCEGITVDVAYGESVDINTLNLILSGEIGLVFHTVVPDKYTDGSFVLTSSKGDTVTYKINECEKDKEGRYLAVYNLSAIELSEPVTLTVCDKNGDEITSKTKTAEEYGNVLLNDKSVTVKEKTAIKALLNYGHFAQIECAEQNGWEIGKDYAETAKYAELTTPDSAFDSYDIRRSGEGQRNAKVGIQLQLGYKTNMKMYFALNEATEITVNGVKADVKDDNYGIYNYSIEIKGINALELSKSFEVKVGDKYAVTLSVLSYCRLAVKQSNESNKNAAKALYEFYMATVNFN